MVAPPINPFARAFTRPGSAGRARVTRTLSALALAFIGCTVLTGCDNHDAPAQVEIRPVRTVIAAPAPAGELVKLTGHIRARTEESLAFRLDGRMVVRRAEVGQALRRNDVVAEIDSQPQRDALNAAEANLSAAKAHFGEASNNLDRQQKLLKGGWTTKVQFDAAERAYRSGAAEVQAAEAQLHTAEDRFGYSQLRADSPGIVTAVGAEPGEVVRAGQMIVTVAQDGGVDAVFDVPASLIHQARPDAPITVALTDDRTVQTSGTVREVAPEADPVTRSFRVKVDLADVPRAMRLGATVTGETRLTAANGIELPATALTMTDNRPAVWVVDPQYQQVSLRLIEVERQGSSTIVVSKGLAAGERVITAGVHALHPGQKVRLEGGVQ